MTALRILLVEDSVGDARLLRELLSEAKGFAHTLSHVDRLSRALDALREHPTDVVLLDLSLPDAIGLAGLRAIHAAHPRVPILVLTGLSDEELAIEAMKSGAQDYLVKGEDDARLLARSIRYAIERSDSQEAARELVRSQIIHATAVAERARLRALFMQAPVGICVLTGADFTFELANPRYLQLVGKTELVGKPLLEGIPELVGQGFEHHLERVMRSGEAFFGNELPCRLDREGDGTLVEVVFDFVYEPVRNAAGAVESIMVIATDVTEHVMARKRVEQARRETSLSEQRFRLLAEAIPQIVWSINADGSEVYLSPRWDEYTGQGAAEILASKGRSAIHPDDYDAWCSSWGAAAQTGGLWQVEYRLRRRDGEYRWHLGRAIPQRSPDGTILRWYGTATDIDVQRRAIRSRDDLLATVSHDLRGPLATISVAAELLSQSNGSERSVSAIQRAARAMERLIQDLLDMASIESGHLSMSPTPRGVPELTEAAVDSIQQVAAAKQIALQLDITAAQPHVLCDRERVLQVFGNILGNAVKFTPSRGRISIHARGPEGGFVTFAVSDTGPGIEPGQLPFVFDRFWQAKDTARAGTGLGLAICKGIIQQHGGSIWVDSQVGAGTTFFFTLPVAESISAAMAGEPARS